MLSTQLLTQVTYSTLRGTQLDSLNFATLSISSESEATSSVPPGLSVAVVGYAWYIQGWFIN